MNQERPEEKYVSHGKRDLTPVLDPASMTVLNPSNADLAAALGTQEPGNTIPESRFESIFPGEEEEVDPFSEDEYAESEEAEAVEYTPRGPRVVKEIGDSLAAYTDGVPQVSDTGAVKNDGGKLRWDLLPVGALTEIVEIFTLGADKYGDRNWEQGMPWKRPFAAMMRHLWAWWGGETFDQETGKSHLAHAGCNLLFLLEYRHIHPEGDDR